MDSSKLTNTKDWSVLVNEYLDHYFSGKHGTLTGYLTKANSMTHIVDLETLLQEGVRGLLLTKYESDVIEVASFPCESYVSSMFLNATCYHDIGDQVTESCNLDIARMTVVNCRTRTWRYRPDSERALIHFEWTRENMERFITHVLCYVDEMVKQVFECRVKGSLHQSAIDAGMNPNTAFPGMKLNEYCNGYQPDTVKTDLVERLEHRPRNELYGPYRPVGGSLEFSKIACSGLLGADDMRMQFSFAWGGEFTFQPNVGTRSLEAQMAGMMVE